METDEDGLRINNAAIYGTSITELVRNTKKGIGEMAWNVRNWKKKSDTLSVEPMKEDEFADFLYTMDKPIDQL